LSQPAILSQESVHTTLSITYHTRKEPSTGPRTTHGPQSPPWWVHWQNPHKVTREKRKRKETNKRKPQQAIESQRKPKNKITWRRQVSDPLGKGNGSTHLRQNHAQTKSANHRTKAQTPQRVPPAHMQAPLEPKHTPPELMQQCNTGMQQRAKFCSPCPGRLDRLHRAVRPPTTHLTARGRLDRPKWPALHQTAQKMPEPIGTPSKHSQVSKSCTNFSPLLTMHESRQNAKSFNI
jgi:hypothetical protein